MKKMKKLMSLVLCVCMSSYALPVFATQSVDDADLDVQKIMLSDIEMSELIGAGNVDATVSDYTAGEQAVAVIANRSSLHCDYTLNTVNSSGGLIEAMVTGSLAPNEAIIVSGTPSPSTDFSAVQARIWNAGVPGLESKDASMK